MNDNKSGGMLLVAGNLIGMVVMALHPVASHGMLDPRVRDHLVLVDRIVHGAALFGIAMIFLGSMALTQRLSKAGRLPFAALVVYGFAAVAIMIAGAMSGFVGADILSRMVEGDPKLESRRMLLDYTFRLNQAFCAIFTVASCAAIILWSISILKSRTFSQLLAYYGMLIGLIIPVLLFAGVLPLDVHGFGLVVLLFAVWLITAGIALTRTAPNPEPGPSECRAAAPPAV